MFVLAIFKDPKMDPPKKISIFLHSPKKRNAIRIIADINCMIHASKKHIKYNKIAFKIAWTNKCTNSI